MGTYKKVARMQQMAYARVMNGKEAIRIVRASGETQAEFARLIGISPVAVQKWASGGNPSGGAATLLRLIEERPELLSVLRAWKR